MKVGILSGTFDPIHRGHVELAEAAIAQLGLDKVLFIPEPKPRYKENVTDYSHRIAMIKLALSRKSKLELLEDDSPYHALSLVDRLRQQIGEDTELYLLLGADVAKKLPDWSNYDELKNQLKIVVVHRENHESEIVDLIVNNPYSSARIRSGEQSDGLHPQVAKYMREHDLYE